MRRKNLVRGLAAGLSLALVAGVALGYNNASNADEVKKQAKKNISVENQELIDAIDGLQSVTTKNGVTTYKIESDGAVHTIEVSGKGANKKLVQSSTDSDQVLVIEQKGKKVKVSQGTMENGEYEETGAQEIDTTQELSSEEMADLQEAVETENYEEVQKKGIFTSLKKENKRKYSYKEKKDEIKIACKLDKSKYMLNKASFDEKAQSAYYKYVYNVNKYEKLYKQNRRRSWFYIMEMSKTALGGTGLAMVFVGVAIVAPISEAIAVIMLCTFEFTAISAVKFIPMYKLFMNKIKPNLDEMKAIDEKLAESYSVLTEYGVKIK